MSGFPNRPTRAAFGPTYTNRRPIRNPEKELDASVGNLMAWQLAGLGLLSPLAWVLSLDGATIAAHAEAWNPAGALAAPGLAHAGAGDYVFTYAASYSDEGGEFAPPALRFGLAAPLALPGSGGTIAATVIPVSGVSLHVVLRLAGTATGTDAPFAAFFW